MFSILVSFFASFILTLLVIRVSRQYQNILDHDLKGAQKFHAHPVSRIGGLAIFLATIVSVCAVYLNTPDVGKWIFLLLFCAAAAFAGGIAEDYTKRVSATKRLILTLFSAVLGYFILDAAIIRIDISWFDPWLNYIWLSLPLTVLAVAGTANAINIIDGFNGLAGAVSTFMLLSLAYVALQVGDQYVLSMSLIMAGAIAGFLIWNYPYGLIFLGDGGAYFIGFMLGELAVLLVARNPEVSAWYAALLMIYPMFEVAFSIYRKRFVRGISPGIPDGVHLHMLVFKRLVRWTVGKKDARALTRRNSLTSPYLWLLSLMAVIPATVYWRHKWVLFAFCVLFVVSYIWLYVMIVRFNTPRWFVLRKGK